MIDRLCPINYNEQKAELPSFDHPAIIQNSTQLARTDQAHRRFALYYWVAIEIFGAVSRIKLPECVLSAVRAKYPNPIGEPYKGHIDL